MNGHSALNANGRYYPDVCIQSSSMIIFNFCPDSRMTSHYKRGFMIIGTFLLKRGRTGVREYVWVEYVVSIAAWEVHQKSQSCRFGLRQCI